MCIELLFVSDVYTPYIVLMHKIAFYVLHTTNIVIYFIMVTVLLLITGR